jgi:hypothetical protein
VPDGLGWTWSPVFRHECEVRHVARMRLVERRRFIEGVAHKRGKPAADRLLADVLTHDRIAREIADMQTNAARAARLREIEGERGVAFAQGLRESAWALMQEVAA